MTPVQLPSIVEARIALKYRQPAIAVSAATSKHGFTVVSEGRERGHRTRYDVEGVGDAHGVKTFLFPALSDRRVFSHVTDLHNLLLLSHVSRQLPDLLRF